MPTIAPATTTTMIDVADLLAALLAPGLGGQPCLPRGALAGSLLAGHGRQTLPNPRVGLGSPRSAGGAPGSGPDEARSRLRDGARAVCSLVRMPLVVQKFGGTSVGDADRIRAVADHIARTRRQGSDVVAVVSAMGKTTDELIHLADSVSATQPPREYDMLVSTGERISMSLLVMALADLGRRRRVLHREPGRHHHRQRPHPGQDQGGQGRPPARGAGRGEGARSWRGSRASRPSGRSPRWAGAAPTRPRWPWPPSSTPTCARSTPTSPASSPPIPGSCPRRTASTGSRSTRCSRWRPPADGS